MSIYGDATTPDQQDAFAAIVNVLKQYGLSDLGQWAWGLLVQGASQDRIGIELYDQPAFKERFPVIEQRRLAGLPAVSPTDVIHYEDMWDQMAISAGLPASFQGRDIAQEAMGKNISLAEMQTRVNEGYRTVAQADPAVRNAFQSYFGSDGDNALASLFIDPERALPDLERMVTEAQIGGAATRQGFQLQQNTAELAARAGVTGSQAQQAFVGLSGNAALFKETAGERGARDLKIEEEGANAALGLSGEDAAAVKRRSQERQAAYGGGDEAYLTTAGVTGVGSARSA